MTAAHGNAKRQMPRIQHIKSTKWLDLLQHGDTVRYEKRACGNAGVYVRGGGDGGGGDTERILMATRTETGTESDHDETVV